jgi:hypothetical protein
LYIITSTGAKYVYHTCSEGQRCPEIDWMWGQIKGCPGKDYIITVTNCEGFWQGSTSTTTPEPRFPFCAWESAPLRATFTYYEIGEAPTHGGGLFIKRVIREVREAKYYDLLLEGHVFQDKLVSCDLYGFRYFAQDKCSFVMDNTWRYFPSHFDNFSEFVNFYWNQYMLSSLGTPLEGYIANDKDGYVQAVYLNIRDWREDVPIPKEVVQQFLDKHNEKCGKIPWCSSSHEAYAHDLEEHNKRAILPALTIGRPLHEGGEQVLQTYGLSLIGEPRNPSETTTFTYLFDPSLFDSGPDKYCKLTYDGSSWVATGTCDRCDVYVDMLNHIMKVCFRTKWHPFIVKGPSNLPRGVYFEASKYTCQCTVGDVVQFLNQIWPFEIYLTCPLDLPDSDYLYIQVERGAYLYYYSYFTGYYTHDFFPLFLPCGANKAPVTYPNVDTVRGGTYLIPCGESRNVECEPQNAKRIFWAFVPWVYQPCLCRERTTS